MRWRCRACIVPELLEKAEKSTLIIGAKCKDGAVLVADRRVIRGKEYTDEKKISLFNGLVVGFAGLTGLRDKYLDAAKAQILGSRARNLNKMITRIEDSMAAISNTYKNRLGAAAQVEALVSGLRNITSGRARLIHVFGAGYSEEVDFMCIGHGARYASFLSQNIGQSAIAADRAARLAIFLVRWVEKVDSSVGGIPDVVLIKDDKGISYMEYRRVKTICDNADKIIKKLPRLISLALNNPGVLRC